MTARAFFLTAGLSALAILVSGNVAYRAGFASGEASGINAAIDRNVIAMRQREARNERLLQFMVNEGRCPPLDSYCPAIRMTSR